MTVGITGANSTIAREFKRLARHDNIVEGQPCRIDSRYGKYLVCTGFLAGKSLAEISQPDVQRTWNLNFFYIARMCDRIFKVNPIARICIIGSESGFAGSYDMAYAGAKAALHLYVQTKRLEFPDQMLVALAPHIIIDAGMTTRRDDLSAVEMRGQQTRMGRWLESKEVAAEAYRLLYHGGPAISGQVIRMRTT